MIAQQNLEKSHTICYHYGDGAIFRKCIDPKVHCSEGALVRRCISPKVH